MKKQSTTKQILNILNTQGGKKPKQLITLTKASSASVYNALHQLRNKKMVAKENDGVYISQTQKETGPRMPIYYEKKATPVSKVTNKVALDTPRYIKSLETQVHELEKLHDGWRQNYKKLEADYTQAKIMYLDSQAVVKYLEEKVAQLIKG
jgi:DeoR/GlpR family transcriptional regulator of sugar metabolism